MRRSGRLTLAALLLFASTLLAQAAPEFPPLTGRVVDQAGLLDAQTRSQLERMLVAHEQATTEQLVVVTLPSLQGEPIEDYGYQLGRHWGIGQKGKDNGALLIVARDERKVRIEVGYGLEDRLTDAQASVIINQLILPAFRRGDFAGGIRSGVTAMLQVLGGQPLAEPRHSAASRQEAPGVPALAFLALLVIVVLMLQGGGGRGGGGGAVLRGALLGGLLGSAGRSSGGGFGGGGFGGGGGSFGGGGASGEW